MTKVSKRKPTKPRTKVVRVMDWSKFAKSIGAKVEKIQNGAACLGWTDPESCCGDNAWFSVNMADQITRAIAPSKGKRK